VNVKDNINDSSKNQQQYKIDPAMKVGHVSLNVSDLSQLLDFCQSVLGFRRIGSSSSSKALLSVGSNDSSYLVELLQVKTGANNDSLVRLRDLLEEQGYTPLQSCFLKESF
jgi:catechol 2,3-dioxygenase-like lactoylglutathione lyase family enzyme